MNNAKAKRKLRGYWIKGDIKGWIDQKYRMKHYTKETKNNTKHFNIDMAIWNERFTHEKTQAKHYTDWNPFCCNSTEPCVSMNRMEKTDDGWKCNSCGLKIGKHLYRIGNIKVVCLLSRFIKENGRPLALLEGYGTIGK